MKLIYGFVNSFFSTNDDMVNQILLIFNKSIESAQRFHELSIYTDLRTKPLLSTKVEHTIVDGSYTFLDDLKIELLNSVPYTQIDPDIILYNKLNIDTTYDASFDFKQPIHNTFTRKLVNNTINCGIESIFPNFSSVNFMPNIGILRIGNQKLIDEYTTMYNKLKLFLLNNNLIKIDYSIILGQYLLGYILMNSNYNVEFVRFKKNEYIHLSGPQKFNDYFKIPPIDKNII